MSVSPLSALRTITTHSEHLFLSLRIVTAEKRYSRWDRVILRKYTHSFPQDNIIFRNKTLKGYLISNLKLYYVNNCMSGGFFRFFHLTFLAITFKMTFMQIYIISQANEEAILSSLGRNEWDPGIIQKTNYVPAGAYFLPSVNTDTSSSPLLEEDLLESVFFHSFVLVLGLFLFTRIKQLQVTGISS